MFLPTADAVNARVGSRASPPGRSCRLAGLSVALFVNPRSRANRRNPGLARDLAALLADVGRVHAPSTLAELAQAVRVARTERPAVIAVHGGDGTLHKTLTALLHAWDGAALPPIATLCGGTMNVVAASLGVRERPAVFLRHIADCVRGGRPLDTLARRLIQVREHDGAAGSDRFGFVFGNGLMANFLGEYYAPGGYGPARAVWLIFRTLCSALWGGPFARRMFRRFRGRVSADGAVLDWPAFTGVGAATVREVGLGFKLNHRADDDPERFGVLAIHSGALALVPDLPGVHSGRGIASSRAWSGVASRLDVVPSEPDMTYTIDGDLYRTSGALHVAIGPRINVVKPARPSVN